MSSMRIPAALRRQVSARAAQRCEYCRVPELITFAAHEIDHIIAQKHGGATESDNLALSCTLCNKHKGSDIASLDPDTGELVALFNPRLQNWTDHFRLHNAEILPLTPTGRATARLLHLNDPDRIEERELLIVVGLLPPLDDV